MDGPQPQGRQARVTVETVTLDPPNRMGFRLLRDPVAPRDRDLHLRRDRRRYPTQLARSWVQAVGDSIAAIKTESERRARG
jgi:hypothetical protein